MTDILIDGWLDGYIEEHGWVAVAIAATPDEAIKRLESEHPIDEIASRYEVTGRSFHKPVGVAVPGHEDLRAEFRDGPCATCEGAKEIDGEPCDDCYGTGRDGDFYSADDEPGQPWTACEAGDDEAVEFWTVERVDVPS